MFAALFISMLTCVSIPAGDVSPSVSMRDEITDYVTTTLRLAPEDVLVDIARSADSVASRGAMECRVMTPAAFIRPGAQILDVDVISREQGVMRLRVPVVVRTFANVLRAARQVARHDTLGEHNVREERIETTASARRDWVGSGDLKGKRAKRIIAEGSIIYAGMVECTPLVNSGDVVVLTSKAGKVTLSTDAIAKQDGSGGEIITVQPAGTHQRIRAQVVNSRHVRAFGE